MHEAKLTTLKRETDISIIIVGHVNFPLYTITKKQIEDRWVCEYLSSIARGMTQSESKQHDLRGSRMYNLLKCMQNSLQYRPYAKP